MSEFIPRCSSCGAQIAKRDCRCKGEGKFTSGWTTEEYSAVARPPAKAEPEAKPEPVMQGDQCVLI